MQQHTRRKRIHTTRKQRSADGAGLHWLSQIEWNALFDSPVVDFPTFKRVAQVRYRRGLRPLQEVANEKQFSEEQLRKIYQDIVEYRTAYLDIVYKRSLQIPESYASLQCMHNLQLPTRLTNNKFPQYKNIPRNLYWKEILQTTKTVHSNLPSYLDVIIDLFRDYIIDYKLLTPSVLAMAKTARIPGALSGLYFRASIMNPVIPFALYKSLLRNPKRVLTPTLGWSSYLLGFMQHPTLERYVGIDVIPRVCETTRHLAKYYRPELSTHIVCTPSEDLANPRTRFYKMYAGHFDAVFFSPPYFQLELYADGEQSTQRYSTYQAWLTGYWRPTIELCAHTLNKQGVLCYILSGYGSTQTGARRVDLVKDMGDIVLQSGFKALPQQYVYGSNVNYTSHRPYSEVICSFVLCT